MTMKLFRCEQGGCDAGEFESANGACPKCSKPSQELVPIHYLVPDDKGPIRTMLGNRLIACQPTLRTLPQSSGERSAVTCPKCKASALFAEHEANNVDNHNRYVEKIAAERGRV